MPIDRELLKAKLAATYLHDEDELPEIPGFRDLQFIGKGGMGAVYVATQTAIGRRVAIKVINRALCDGEQLRRRFLAECRSLGKLDHPNIVRIHDARAFKWEGVRTPYLVMEYVDGENLRACLQRKRLSAKQVSRIMSQLCAALEHAHSKQIIHRDIKPENILIDTSGNVRLTDFGIAHDASAERITTDGGTPHTRGYSAPEVQAGRSVTPQADIYSCGVLLCELMTGRTPDPDFDVVRQMGEEFAEWKRTIQKATAWNWNDRYVSVAEFREAILRCSTKAAATSSATSKAKERLATDIQHRERGSKLPQAGEIKHVVAEVACPNPTCRATFKLHTQFAGRRARCNSCGCAVCVNDDLSGVSPVLPHSTKETTSERSSVTLANPVERRPVSISSLIPGVIAGSVLLVAAVSGLLLWKNRLSSAAPDHTKAVVSDERGDAEPPGSIQPADTTSDSPSSSEFPTATADESTGEDDLASSEHGDSFTNSLGILLKQIPPGEFLMGSPFTERGVNDDEQPRHRVQISRGFFIGIHEVTRAQFALFVEAEDYQTDAEKEVHHNRGQDGSRPVQTWYWTGFQYENDHPVVNVSWNDATSFCEWLSRKEGRTYRLPTEAEWEYVCRGGTSTVFWFGDNAESLRDVENVSGNRTFTTPVGSHEPNPFGVYDILGNVQEWCADAYDRQYYSHSPASNPQGPQFGNKRVYRGGGWNILPRDSRSAARFSAYDAHQGHGLGFRVAADAAE